MTSAGCEICKKHAPLTRHHLIPRSTHEMVLKKGWHPKQKLNSLAKLCRPCHNAVHNYASNEKLARSFHTLHLLLQQEPFQTLRKSATRAAKQLAAKKAAKKAASKAAKRSRMKTVDAKQTRKKGSKRR